MKPREDRQYQMIISRELLPCVPLCFFSMKVSHFTLCFFFLDYKKVDSESKCFSSTPHIYPHAQASSVPLSSMIANSCLFAGA